MQSKSTAYGPYGNGCEDTLGFSRGGDSAPISINLNGDHAQGTWSVHVNVGDGGYGNFGFADQAVQFSDSVYRYVHLWVKPLTAGSWLSFHCWNVDSTQWRDMNGDRDGDGRWECGEGLVAGQWNEVWVDLRQNVQGQLVGMVRSVHMHSSGNSQFLVDGIYTVSQPWQTFWYHCDFLGSPRVMTDASGTVIWKQDYYAFGGDYGTPATGNTHKFTGHVQDAATGQYYAKARYFTTTLGRWSQPEPLLKGVPGKSFVANPQLLNPYIYCRNNPVTRIDENGKWDIKVTLPRDRTQTGTLSLIGNNGLKYADFETLGRGSPCKANNNNSSNTFLRNANTPEGLYSLSKVMSTENQNQRSFGPNGKIMLTPLLGDASLSYRTELRIHGGDLNSSGELRPTNGCLRLSNENMAKLAEMINMLENSFEDEGPGTAQIIEEGEEEENSDNVLIKWIQWMNTSRPNDI